MKIWFVMALTEIKTNTWKRETKGKREKERYTHCNAEFQRIARRDKKAFLSDQYKEIEENNRMGKRKTIRILKLKIKKMVII